MKQKMMGLLTGALLVSSLFIFSISARAQSAGIERIEDFNSAITINKDGTMSVKETLLYNFGENERHGIYRTIPAVKTNKDGKKYELNVSVLSVTDELGTSYQYDITTGSDIKIKIGDPNQTITGKHTYVISYNVSGAITYFSDHDELYWDITGNGWTIPISKATAQLSLPQAPALGDSKLACYTGAAGSSEANCTFETSANTFTYQTQAELGAAQGLTAVLGFPKNIVAVIEPKQQVNFATTPMGILAAFITALIGLIWYVGLPAYIVINWFLHGRDPKVAGPVSAWFDPPKTKSGRFLTPAEVGTLVDESADMQDVSAMIVNLAQRGYFKIVEKVKGEFSFVKSKEFDADSSLQSFEKIFLTGLFGKTDTVDIKGTDLHDVVGLTNTALYKAVVAEGYFQENPQTVRTKYYILAGIALFTGNFFLAIVAFIFGRIMPRKTVTGAEATSVATSLKNFLVSQERQLEFQAKNQMFFEKLLPFAVAFGVEKVWADRFKDIAFQQPSWYQGYNTDLYTANMLTNSLASSFSSFTTAATPTSSSSGFSSGFSGGFSGGGGGGGGGGSW